MLPLGAKYRRMFVVRALLFYGMLHRNYMFSSETCDACGLKKVLLVSASPDISSDCHIKSVTIPHINKGFELCVTINKKKTDTDCCPGFSCPGEVKDLGGGKYSLSLNKTTLSKQDIVLMTSPLQNFLCLPSKLYNAKDLLLQLHNCLDTGNKNIRLSRNGLCGTDSPKDEEACEGGLTGSDYKLTISANGKRRCVWCEAPENTSDVSITVPPSWSSNSTSISPQQAAEVMNNLSSLLGQMGQSNTATITIGDVKGVLAKLPTEKENCISFGISADYEVKFYRNSSDLETRFSRLVQIPKEACDMAVTRNGSFLGMLLFPRMYQDDPDNFYANNESLAVEMGANISNLSHTIDIHYRHMDTHGRVASCRSWDGKGKEATWITDGCQTKENNGSITCQCTHLTFFAVVLSPPPANLSSSDFVNLTYITSVGCGLSLTFLAVAFVMHCFNRRGKASNATKILINLFGAMFTLNVSFLVNESVASLGNLGVCVAMAAITHYSLLATCSWFFIEALHLHLYAWMLPNEIRHYMLKICITGWVIPAVVVIVLLAWRKYGYLVIHTDDGNSTKMCWIYNAVVHQVVNLGYYAITFILTFTTFIITVWQVFLFRPTEKKYAQNNMKTKFLSILTLLMLLGITWAFAFFSFGELRISSYYIFTILNSFHGFFLFIYYYNTSKIGGENQSSTATSDTIITSPYQ